MNDLSDFGFLSPAWLISLPIAWGLVFAFGHYFRGLSSWPRQCDAAFLALLMPAKNRRRWPWQAYLLTFIFSIGIVAMAGPSWQKQDYPLLQSATARIVILDLSQSMLVEDVKPNRLGQAIGVARAIIGSGFDGETGLVVFAGAAFQVSPLTRDSSSLLEFIEALHPDTMPLDGARLDLAIATAQGQLAASITGTGQMIVISDGADDLEKTLAAAFEASRQGNQISLVAIGTAEGAPLKNAQGGLQRNDQGLFTLAKTEFSDLESIASAGRGRFVKMSEFDGNIESLIAGLESLSLETIQDSQDDAYRAPENGGIWLVWLMLPLALFLFRKNAFWVLLLVLLSPLDGELQAKEFNSWWHNTEQRAYAAYQQKKYDQVNLLSRNTELIGSALFKAGKYQAAYESFALGDSAESHYNRGNALAYLNRFDDALIAYHQALALRPGFEDAEINRRLIAAYLALQTSAAGEHADEPTDSNDSEELSTDATDQTRPGQSESENTGRSESEQAGVGASLLLERGRIAEDEDFDGADQALEQFLQQIRKENFNPDPELVRIWAKSHSTDPAEFFRRKFLRDYQRERSRGR